MSVCRVCPHFFIAEYCNIRAMLQVQTNAAVVVVCFMSAGKFDCTVAVKSCLGIFLGKLFVLLCVGYYS